MGEPGRSPDDLLSLEALTRRVGMSVRNVRFYASRGLVPPPIRRGRQGFYGPVHLARLELVQELQAHGFTLAAIERYVGSIPATAGPEDIALHRTMLAPWSAEQPVEMSRTELEARAGRELTDEDLETLATLGIVREGPGTGLRVAVSQLSVGIGLLDLGFPTAAAVAAAGVYARHGREIAEELHELFRTIVVPHYAESGERSREVLREVAERVKPLSIASLVAAYELALEEQARQRRSG